MMHIYYCNLLKKNHEAKRLKKLELLLNGT